MGHLVPAADYFFEFEKRATDYFINIVPQWMHFNSIAWNSIEKVMRKYSVEKNVHLQIYTGTLYQMRLKHLNGSYVRIYLTGNIKKVPVPGYIWKIIYDEQNLAGVAIIGINNFFLRDRYRTQCNDISPLLPWIDERTRKYVYACTIDDWLPMVNYSMNVPNFVVKDILGVDLSKGGTRRRNVASSIKKTASSACVLKKLFYELLKFFGF